MGKEKLTLTVDEQVISRAKEIGLNISEITETALRGFSFTAKDVGSEQMNEAHRKLFETMMPLLTEYGASMPVGSYEMFDDDGHCVDEDLLYLGPNGNLFCELDDTPRFTVDTIFSDPEHVHFHPDPVGTMLSQFVDALTQVVNYRKESMEKLAMAMNIVKAIDVTMIGRQCWDIVTPDKVALAVKGAITRGSQRRIPVRSVAVRQRMSIGQAILMVLAKTDAREDKLRDETKRLAGDAYSARLFEAVLNGFINRGVVKTDTRTGLYCLSRVW